ncbi:MAG: helix-turn-helix domain-containing protein [Oscillospiraceae bacterium]|nr:helix-turn-helix domain-containing protein [Oscillospiraceae bacterium]
MNRKLSPWCKQAKIVMIEKDISVPELADYLGMSRSYISTILNGRIYSEPAVKRISDYLGIQDSSETTVLQ